MEGGTQATVLVLAEHDNTLHETVALFERDGFNVHMASGEDKVTGWISSLQPSLVAYRLTDAATRRTVCRSTLQAVAALPGPRTPSLALCETNEVNAAAALCAEGLADDYLVVSHLADDPDRLATTARRLISLRQRHAQEARQADALAHLWQTFSRVDFELQQELARIDTAGRATEALAGLRAAHHRTRSRLSGAPVLVVEDDPDFQALLATLVGAMKFPVVTAGDAAAALDWLERNEPALILLDYQMPGQDGATFLEWIRKSPRLHAVPVIMLTGHSRPDTVHRVRRLGVTDFIVKPGDPAAIMKKIAACL